MQKMAHFRKKLSTGLVAAAAGIIMCVGMTAMASEITSEAASLDMTTDYPGITVNPGDTLSFSLDFSSDEACDAALSVESIPEGWTGYFGGDGNQVSMVHINSGTEADNAELATFNLTLPDEAEEGTYTVELAADAGSSGSDTLELEITVNQEELGQSSFTAEYPEQQGATGTSFSFDTTLVNNRATEQSYSLSAEAPTGWTVSFTPSSETSQVASVALESGASEGITVDVTPPENVEKGEYTITCTATSASDTLTMELSIEITGTYGVSLSTPTGNLSLDAYANDQRSVTLSITNTGNVDLENLNLTSSAPTDWEVEFSESTIELLEAGATQEITAYITPDADAITGDYLTTLTVSNDETSADAQFRVSVKIRTTWGIVAVAIIVVLVILLGCIFKKFGRR